MSEKRGMSEKTTVPAIEGWFETGATPHLARQPLQALQDVLLPERDDVLPQPRVRQ
jgi:hypothetical protein